ncbi:actin family [Immersiella caudata]|uniref:Actin family n=1 Tax=Immersiella caudata TaxID=314043 RepID=A0AA40BUV8_9PEZI|nr:actin family [Immersiella caudata]
MQSINRSCTTKFGFGGDPEPAELSSVVGRWKYMPMCLLGSTIRDSYVGDEMHGQEGHLKYSYPISGNHVTSWDDVEILWRHIFRSKLKIDPEEHPLLVTAPEVGRTERDNYKLATILFETYEVPRAFVASPSALSLLGFGRSTGLVIDSGHGQTTCVPIYNGFPLPHAAQSLPLGGREIASNLGALLPPWAPKPDEVALMDIKEKFCRIELDPYRGVDEKSLEAGKYTLPDGKAISIELEAFLAPEPLFAPFLGLPATVQRVIAAADASLKEELWGNIVLTGGNTAMPGFCERLSQDLELLTPSGIKKQIGGFRDPKTAAWRGGSMLSSLSTFRDMCIPYNEYDEYGPVLLRRKCLGICQ